MKYILAFLYNHKSKAGKRRQVKGRAASKTDVRSTEQVLAGFAKLDGQKARNLSSI